MNKPMMIYILGFMSSWYEFVDHEYIAAFYWFVGTIILSILVLLIEFRFANKWFTFRSPRKEDKSKLLEKCSSYLQNEFNIIKVTKKEIKGSFRRKWFEQVFTIRSNKNLLEVNVRGDFPFPISLFNWFCTHSALKTELAGHAYRKV